MKRIISLLLCLITILTFGPISFANEGECYTISNADEFKNFLKNYTNFSKAIVVLEDDITFYDGTFSLGEESELLYNGSADLPEIFDSIENFNGTFDGQGHTISGLYLNTGFFKNCNDATIKNMNITNSIVVNKSTSESCGTLCSYAKDTEFINCKIDAIVISDANAVGGALGKTENCTISGVRNYGDVYALANGSAVGGAIGYASDSVIDNSCNQGTVSGYNCGGFIGQSLHNKLTTCYNSGNITGEANCGGLAYNLLPYDNGTEIRYNGDRPYETKPDRSVKYCYTVGEVVGKKTGEFCYSYSGDIFEIGYSYFVGDLLEADADGFISLQYDGYLWENSNGSGYETADNIPLSFELFAKGTAEEMKFYGKNLGYCKDVGNENNGFPILIKHHNHIWSNFIYNNDGTETAVCLCTGCDEVYTRECSDEEIRVGSIIEHGSYPQSQVTDEAIIAKLEKEDKEWISYGYYSGENKIGSMSASEYMKYADFTFDGNKYRAVTFSEYRPAMTTAEHPKTTYGIDGVWQAVNGYTLDNVYYFKYEPLEWRVLDPDTGLVVCVTVIDSQPYSNTVYYKNSDYKYYNNLNKTVYASNYETSSIRNWLNDDFYNTAFSEKEQLDIAASTVITKDISDSTYDSVNTDDKIFLLSVDEVYNRNYGFISDETRVFLGTDYAKCQGLKTDDYQGSDTFGYPLRIHLRTSNGSQMNCLLSAAGNTELTDVVYNSSHGIVPAMHIVKHKHSFIESARITSTCYQDGSVTYTCVCGDSYIEILDRTKHAFGEYMPDDSGVTETAVCQNEGCTATVTREYKFAASDAYGVTATYSQDCFNEEVTLEVNEITGGREPGGIYMVDGNTYRQIGIYNIKTVSESGNIVQPNDGFTVTVKMPLPDDYKERTDVVIYHHFTDGGREKLSSADGTLKVENGYIIFEVSRFSEFEILLPAASAEITKLPDKTKYIYKSSAVDLSGIEITITEPDGAVKVIDDISLMTVYGFDSNTTGLQTVTVTYEEYSVQFQVEVYYSWWQWIIRIILLGFFWF